MKRLWSTALLVWTSIFTYAAAAEVDPLDWPYWRGLEGNSISRETGLPDTINPDGGEGSNLLWKRADLGGRSTPIVMRGKLYSIMRADPATPTEGERVVCVDAATGETIWESRHNVWSSEVPDTRVGWSSVVGDPATGRVYALGACGLFECFEGDTGKKVWSLPLHEQLGLLSTYGGRTNFPIIVDDLVILGAVIIGWGDMAVPAHRIVAFDKATGKIAWFISTRLRPEDTIYSGPTVAVFNGQKLLLTGSGDGWLYALQPRTGQKVWEYQFSRRGLNVSPTVDGDTIYMGHSEENWDDPENPQQKLKVGAVAAIKGTLTGNITKTGEIWKNLEMAVGKGSILKVGDNLFCPDDAGKIWILNAKTGEPVGRKLSVGTINFATPVLAEDKIYHLEKNGRWYIMDTTGKFQRGKTAGFFPSGDECWASPVISHGRLYIQTTGALHCFEDKTKPHGATPAPAAPQESPVASDDKPAQVQVFPAESLLRPGEKVQYTVRLFNSRGQFLSNAQPESVQFTLDGPGSITPAGEFTAPDDATHSATIVNVKVGELAGRARLRIVPPLPWRFDFEGLKDAPITWVGARYRHVLRQVDGNTAMVKITTIPRGTKSRLSMGHSDLSDYTVQEDFKAAIVDNKLPDTGVIAQGYTLEVSGENKWLKLFSWGSHDKRTFKEIPFLLEPNVWYTLKLRATVADGKAQLQGKVWKRDDKEPADWTIELTDPMPNTHGAPGLFGNATNAELFIDNVLVTPNSAN
ncbi:MAG: PQQ-binding-like beta-propeller repeat protein [Pirellulaceae bacterium]|nr:PQQ-binding-like beta-propeller repeat protein [Pirellulaceae bacterium]